MSGNQDYWWKFGAEIFLSDVINKINLSRNSEHLVDSVSPLFDALNKLWNQYFLYRNNDPVNRRDTSSFRQLLLETLPEISKRELCEGTQLKELVRLSPKIMNHATLMDFSYDPDHITEQQKEQSQREHRELNEEYDRFHSRDKETRSSTKLIKKLVRLLFVIRSNIMHGEKTPHGPDKNKVKRDETVCASVLPLLEIVLDYLFDSPSQKLCAYGTLAPGAVNHYILENLAGEWYPGHVKGNISYKNNLPYFQWDLGEQRIDVQVFQSLELCKKYDEIDDFEGSAYRRVLVPVKTARSFEVANIYEGGK